MPHHNPWTPSQTTLLTRLRSIDHLSWLDIATHLSRTPAACQKKYSQFKNTLKSDKLWSAREDYLLMDMHVAKLMSDNPVAKSGLQGRGAKAIRKRRVALTYEGERSVYVAKLEMVSGRKIGGRARNGIDKAMGSNKYDWVHRKGGGREEVEIEVEGIEGD